MGKRTCLFVSTLVLFGLGFCLAPALPVWAQQAAAKPTLADADCAKCHEREPREIAEKGSAHKTEISCMACHESHRPKVANNIPECSNCHSGAPHYELKNCKTCHNPHMPLDITLKGELKEVCLTCHQQQGQETKASPSKHAEVACNFCHANKHGMIPECVQCHKPHAPTMTQADCKTCHQAHQPLLLTYGPQTANIQCAACHQKANDLLMASETKHRSVTCVTCHANKHKTVPQCSDCHGKPHAAGMHEKFPRCGDCHNIAHDLNSWKGQQAPKAGPAPKAPAPKAPAPKTPQGTKK
jgi:predicted CXXCH cytochrome family protein